VFRFPLISLFFLLLAYAVFSWFLYNETTPLLVWGGATLFAVTQALLLTALARGFRLFIQRWLRSDVGYFSMVLLGAISIAFILVWYHIFEHVMLVVSAEILTRLDLQNAGFNNWQALGVLTAVSVSGLILGWAARYVILQ
jgi:hypothetical protein